MIQGVAGECCPVHTQNLIEYRLDIRWQGVPGLLIHHGVIDRVVKVDQSVVMQFVSEPERPQRSPGPDTTIDDTSFQRQEAVGHGDVFRGGSPGLYGG